MRDKGATVIDSVKSVQDIPEFHLEKAMLKSSSQMHVFQVHSENRFLLNWYNLCEEFSTFVDRTEQS